MKATLFSRVPYMGPAPGGVWPVPPAAFAPEAAEQSMDGLLVLEVPKRSSTSGHSIPIVKGKKAT